jgi:integrase
VSIRWRNGKAIVEIYDPVKGAKVHVKPADFGVATPTNERQAARLERMALNARDKRRPGTGDETVGSFVERWPLDYTANRGESTRLHNAERVRAFGEEYEARTLRSVTRGEARAWTERRPGSLAALRAMFSDAVEDRLADDNPFAKLGLHGSRGRADITVLTLAELDQLCGLAVEAHGESFGPEFAALITWAAFTCMRPGEAFAARFSLLDGDVYHLEEQFNSRLRRNAPPKHDSVGTIYVPDQARRAVLGKPRRLGDDLMFRSKRGKQLRQEGLHRAWTPVRTAFLATLPAGHHLRHRLAVDPDDRMDFYELRHLGASHMLNELGLEPWVIAEQLRHKDGGALVLKRYGHPKRETALARIRKAYGAAAGDNVRQLRADDDREAM